MSKKVLFRRTDLNPELFPTHAAAAASCCRSRPGLVKLLYHASDASCQLMLEFPAEGASSWGSSADCDAAAASRCLPPEFSAKGVSRAVSPLVSRRRRHHLSIAQSMFATQELQQNDLERLVFLEHDLNAAVAGSLDVEYLKAAAVCFKKAAQSFREAMQLDPVNELYLKFLELSAKASELHKELQMLMASQLAS